MIHVGDCLEVMPTLEACSFDSIVTDPPYGLGFMGKAWDHAVPGVPFWLEMLRLAKPGAFLAAFGGTRTSHRMACAIEDAGWELRDTVMWVYGSGFPKSHNLCRCGNERVDSGLVDAHGWRLCGKCSNQFELGTALKPAWEPIILARKPLAGTVAENVAALGTGAMNIDGCRVPGDKPDTSSNRGGIPCRHNENQPRAPRGRDGEASANRRYSESGGTDFAATPGPRGGDPLGRWPANVVHDGSDEVLAAFPNAPGQSAEVGPQHGAKDSVNTFGDYGARELFQPRGDTGSAARFFYCAKASRQDRNAGCEGMTERPLLWSSGTENPGSFQAEGTRRASENNHPTVKPTDLMRWLCRLVTPRSGVVLDPFTGSGSTGRGALAEGFQFVGIELDPDYAAIAAARIRASQPGLSLGAAA